jgi:dienelactone hydrolase
MSQQCLLTGEPARTYHCGNPDGLRPVTVERVRFSNGTGATLVGDLVRPVGIDGQLAAIVVTGSWTTVKEQMAGVYARQLAAAGFACLAFDFTGWGQSGGRVREQEDPRLKASDIRAAVSMLSGVSDIDPDRIGALGICASAGYTATNAASDERVRALGLVAPWLHDPETVKPYYGGDRGVADRIRAGKAARERFLDTGSVDYIPAASATDSAAAMYGPYGYYLDSDRGAVPEWANRFAVMSWPSWLEYDPIPMATAITQPTRIVHSHAGALPEGAIEFAKRHAGQVRLDWTSGSQLDFYDRPRQVGVAVAAMAEHFGATL